MDILRASGKKETRDYHNLVVTTGKAYLASRAAGNTAAIMSNMSLGTGTTTPAVGDTTLTTEIGRVATSSFTASGVTITANANFPAGTATGAITEAGIFNDPTAGSMLSHTVFPVVNKAAGDQISVTWTITIN